MILFSSLLLISFLTFIKPSFSATVEPASVKHVYPSQINPQKDSSPYMPPLAKPRKPTTTSNHVSHIQASSAHPARSTVASHRGAGDPCGPVGNQTEFESTLNTCGQINSTYTHAPSIYGVQCLKANPTFNQTINTTSCASNIDDICEKISSSRATVSGWNWSSGGPNCTMGIWFNPSPAAQPSLSFSVCQRDIYQLMQSTCFPSQGGQFDVAATNLQTLPGVGTNGSQVDSGYPSYIIVPETYHNIYTDTSDGEDASDGEGEYNGEGEYDGNGEEDED